MVFLREPVTWPILYRFDNPHEVRVSTIQSRKNRKILLTNRKNASIIHPYSKCVEEIMRCGEVYREWAAGVSPCPRAEAVSFLSRDSERIVRVHGGRSVIMAQGLSEP